MWAPLKILRCFEKQDAISKPSTACAHPPILLVWLGQASGAWFPGLVSQFACRRSPSAPQALSRTRNSTVPPLLRPVPPTGLLGKNSCGRPNLLRQRGIQVKLAQVTLRKLLCRGKFRSELTGYRHLAAQAGPWGKSRPPCGGSMQTSRACPASGPGADRERGCCCLPHASARCKDKLPHPPPPPADFCCHGADQHAEGQHHAKHWDARHTSARHALAAPRFLAAVATEEVPACAEGAASQCHTWQSRHVASAAQALRTTFRLQQDLRNTPSLGRTTLASEALSVCWQAGTLSNDVQDAFCKQGTDTEKVVLVSPPSVKEDTSSSIGDGEPSVRAVIRHTALSSST